MQAEIPEEKWLHGAEEVSWDLSTLFPDPDSAERTLTAVDAEAERFAASYAGRIHQTGAEELAEAFRGYEQIQDRLGRVQAYAYLRWSADTTKSEHGAFLQKVLEVSSRIAQRLLFLELEWIQIEDAQATILLKSEPLQHYRHYLEVLRLRKPHVLTEAEEKILAEKSVTGTAAWTRFFDQLLGAARFDYRGQSLSEQEILAKLHEPDRQTRREAALAVSEGLSKHLPTLVFVFNTVLAEKASDDRLRKFDHWLAARNLSNEIQDATVNALVDAVTARYDLVARYYALKAKWLNVEKLEDYDRYAPVPGGRARYSWEEARKVVVEAYASFHPEFGALADRFFEERWIDAAVRPGKRGGAYSHGTVPTAHPFILLNYTGTVRDVQTLAHELGHGIHQYLSRDRGVLQASTPLTMAETASVFGEMLVFQNLLEKEQEAQTSLSMLAAKIDDTIATVFRQIAMNRFEDAIHTSRKNSGELPPERFGELWMRSQQEMFQGSVVLNDYYSAWWSYIPHFVHTPGYVYAYAFGELLVLSLYELYTRSGADFVDKYASLLSAGGSDWPEKLLQPFAIDLQDPAFWSHGLSAIERLILQAEVLSS